MFAFYSRLLDSTSALIIYFLFGGVHLSANHSESHTNQLTSVVTTPTYVVFPFVNTAMLLSQQPLVCVNGWDALPENKAWKYELSF